jgi:hypothetical protein
MFNNLSQQAKALFFNEDPIAVYGALYTFLDSKEEKELSGFP